MVQVIALLALYKQRFIILLLVMKELEIARCIFYSSKYVSQFTGISR